MIIFTINGDGLVARVSLVAQLVKNLPVMWETWVWSLGWEDSLEKGKATHSSILAWRIPWMVTKLCLTLATSWTVACQPPLSMGFSRQEYWSGLLFLPAGDLLDPEIKPESPALQSDSLLSEKPGKPL